MVVHKALSLALLPLFSLVSTALVAQGQPGATAAAAQKVQPVLTEDIIAKIKEEGLERSQVMEYLDHLTNTIGHRLTGSDNFDRAARWARDEFEKMGLDAKLEKWGEWKVRWNRGQWQGRVVEPIGMDLQVATAAWTAGTRGRQRGLLLPMPGSVEEVRELGDRLKDGYVLMPPRAGGRRMRRGPLIPANLQAALEEAGCAGLVMSSSGDRKYPNRIRVFGSPNVNPQRLPKLPQIVVRRDQFQTLQKLMLENDKVEVEFDIRNRFRVEPVPLYNVVAELKGTEKPDEYVVVCGHLDSWHQATGTTDNGTGTTSTMECARILTAVGAKPRRTIRFCLWGGEEQGLLGSRRHVTVLHTNEMKNVSACLNHDTGTNWAHSLSVTPEMYADMQRVMAPVMTMKAPDKDHKGPVFVLRNGGMGRGGGSDHASFLARGVPGWSWGLTGRSDYFGYTWHSQWDTFDVAIPEYQRHNATVFALAALGIANLPNLLPREGVGRGGRGRGGQNRNSVAEAGVEGWLGLELKDGTMTVESVSKSGIANRAGIKPGDDLHEFNGTRAYAPWRLLRAAREAKAPYTITVKRGDKEVELKLDLKEGEAPPRGRRRRD